MRFAVAPACTYRCAVARGVYDPRMLFWAPPRHAMTISGVDWTQPSDIVSDLEAACRMIIDDSLKPLEPGVVTDKQAADIERSAAELRERIARQR